MRYAANGFALVAASCARRCLAAPMSMPGPWAVHYRTGPWYFNTGYGLNKAKYAAVTSPFRVS